ncbi:hypothetical protein BJY04DRAFT_195122 [Aspergillus karnatakaensis]|uniref:Zn(II)2Cys6 transcription factor domain-containing protein n=1 Tax=Aspergillus karnatakaensis TaxID=1810916 RepID=UPI003CCE48F9
MVGVPGRSKACVTCLKRKKRCDLEKPFCGTCRKARVECGGYHRPRIFINNTIENQSQQLVRKGKSTSDGDSDTTTSVALPNSLAHSAYQAKYMDLFWRLYLPNGQALTVELTQVALGGWVDAIIDLHTSDNVLRKALVAMSVSAVGKMEDSRLLREEGRKLYTGSLQSLASALKDPRRATSDATLTAIRLSSFWESMFGQSDGEIQQARAWQAHNLGDIALISSRSPYSFMSGHAHELFADGRTNLTMSYLRNRKRCFLADPEWKTIPWLQQPKTPRDHLFDVLLDLTGLFEDLDLMKICPNPGKKELAKKHIIDRFFQLHQDLLAWEILYSPPYEPPLQPPETVRPQEIAGAHLMTTYWASVIIVASNLQSLVGPDNELELGVDLDLFCSKLIRSSRLFVHPSLGLFRTHITTYPMTVAIHYICAAGPKRLVEERRLLADCLYDPALSGVRQFIVSMKDDQPLEFLE